ncbi:ATP-binding protein [Desulfomicrobium salsuginis]
MKIKQKLVSSAVLTIGLIILMSAFAAHDMNAVIARLKFVELADDLNASFLEMRLAEKNYLLFDDSRALNEITEKTRSIKSILDQVKPDILSPTGPDNIATLRTYLAEYANIADATAHAGARDESAETALREAGRRLREFSEHLIRVEREDVNRIINASKQRMFVSFLAILITAVLAGPLVFSRILRSLRAVADLAGSISRGRFRRIEGPVPNDELGSVIHAMNSMSEELRSRESELLQSKKLASIGTLTAGVAHEITNPLNNISMLAETFETLYGDLSPEDHVDFMRKVGMEVERIRQIVVGLLDFSKPKKADQRMVSLNEILTGTMRLVRNMLDVSNIEVEFDLDDTLLPVFVDVNQIHQVLVNIITNAIQAMGPGGRLRIATRRGETDDFMAVRISDTGKGIPPELLPHIFDPFFSTKGVDGTGLGLSVSYGIIKNHGGRIRAENAPSGGSIFTIDLPSHKMNAPSSQEDQQ